MKRIDLVSGELEKKRILLEDRASVLDAQAQRVKEKSEELSVSVSAAEATKKELNERILSLGSERLNLESDQIILKNDIARLSEQSHKISEQLKTLSEKETAIKTKEIQVEEKMASLKGKILDIEVRELAVSEKEKEVLSDRDNNLAVSQQLKIDRGVLEDRERQISIRERSFNNESAIRKRELEERESRIKSLESKIGG